MATTLPRNKIPKGYVKLAPSMVRRLNNARIAIYFWNGETPWPVLYRQADIVLDEETLEHALMERGDNLYAKAYDYHNACSELVASLDEVILDDSISPTDRFQVIQMAVSAEIDRTLKLVDAGKFVELVADVSRHINRLVTESELLPEELFAIAKHDSQTFTHVTNVAGYATMLAERLGITKEAELDEIAMGAMLHDLGKRSIPASIITKPGRLTNEEKEIIRSHPLRGYEELYPRLDLSKAQLLMVYQHHEHVDGNGYPVRILQDEIHPWARLLAVVDVFDALTANRPYRHPMTMNEAIEFILDRVDKQFDEEMAKCWASTIKKQ